MSDISFEIGIDSILVLGVKFGREQTCNLIYRLSIGGNLSPNDLYALQELYLSKMPRHSYKDNHDMVCLVCNWNMSS